MTLLKNVLSDAEPTYDDYDEAGADNVEADGEDGAGAGGEDGAGGATEDPDARRPTGAVADHNNVVAAGDPAAAAAAAKSRNTVLGVKEKRIANDKRTTTPYMTKYERARVLGTRALQIR